jgi:hypothetical protein
MGEMNSTTSLGAAIALVTAQIAPMPMFAPMGLAGAAAQASARSVSVSCYSTGNQTNSCRLPAETVSVYYVGNNRQCREGDTWRRVGNTIEVRNGCGGNFDVRLGGGGSGGGSGGGWGGSGGSSQGFAGEITCRSQNGLQESCSAQTENRVRLLQQYSSTQCVEGRNWRYTRSSILVSGGCQARFGYGYGNSGGGGWGGGNNSQGFAGEIVCRSQNNREENCYARTENRVRLLQQYSSTQCVEGRNWRYTSNQIQVRDGCGGRFGYGYGNSGGSGGGWGGGGSNQGFAGQLECRSQDNRYRRCTAFTDNRVELLRQFSSSECTRGRSWGFDRNSIWVDRGCQARFGYGYGNVSGDTSGDSGGSDVGSVVGGVALAAGLIALLAAAGKSSSSTSSRSAAPATATLNADMSKFPSDARVPGQACMQEAARQVGATGGTAVSLDAIDTVQRSGEGWMIVARVTGTYQGQPQRMTMDCRATGDKVTAFDVR